MPQTLLVLLALSLTALLSFGQQRITIQSHEVRVRDEMSVAGSGMLMQVMEMIAARSFDEETTPQRINAQQVMPTLADLTASSDFGLLEPTPGIPGNGNAYGIGNGEGGPVGGGGVPIDCDLLDPWRTPLCNDIDDLHGIEWQRVEVPLSNGTSLPFEVSVSVSYVNELDPSIPSADPTFSKLVVLRARTPVLPRVEELIRLERVITYDARRAEMEYEVVFGPLNPS